LRDYLSERGERFSKSWNRLPPTLPPTLALVCVVLLAAWMGNASGGYFVHNWVPPALILAALALFVSVIGPPRDTKLWWGTLALGLFAAYAAWTFASLLWSPNVGDAWLGAGRTLLYLLAFWVAVVSVALGASRRWVLGASVLGPAVVAAFTLPALGPRLEDLFDNERLAGTVGYYNGEAAFLLVPFWIAVYLAGSRGVNPILRGAVLAGAVLSVDLAILTQSRGAVVAIAASLPIFFLLSGQRLRGLFALVPIAAALYVAFPSLNGVYLAFLGGEAPVATLLGLVLPTLWLTAALAGLYGLFWGLVDWHWRPPRSVVRIIGGITLVSGAVLLAAGAITLVERVGEPVVLVQQKWEAFKTNDTTGQDESHYLSASGTGRYALWQVAWRDFATHPVLGVGTQNYEATYYQLREQRSGFARQAHALPLEVLAERGIVGGALFFGLLATCLVAGLWERYRNLHSEGKAQVGALVAAVGYWFVHSSAEWFWQIPAVTLPAIVYLALLVSPWRRVGAASAFSGRPTPRWPLRTAGIGVAVLTVAIVGPLYVADHYLERSRATIDPAEGLTMVERAQRFNPLNSRLPEQEAELAIETGDWNRAEDAYNRAIQLNPEHFAPYMFLATAHERRGNFEKALLYYQKALTLNPLSNDLDRHIRQLESAEAGVG
jgi:hypothetical protein